MTLTYHSIVCFFISKGSRCSLLYQRGRKQKENENKYNEEEQNKKKKHVDTFCQFIFCY